MNSIFITFEPIESKTAAIHKNPSPKKNIQLMSFISSMKFSSKIFDKFHVNMRPLYDLLHDITRSHWKKNSKHFVNKLGLLFQRCYADIPQTPKQTIPSLLS